MTPELIESSTKMDELVSYLNNEKLIAVDTEFHRETTYYPQLALIQIATDSLVACIDPLAFNAKLALKNILLNSNITKVFHSCSQDLEVLYYYLGATPTPVYDTQLANGLLSDHHQIGYAALVERELGVQLDKSQTRTNWLQRPLTDKQIQYAGDDVIYLYQLHNILDDKLRIKGRKTWFDEDCAMLFADEKSFQIATDNLWMRVKGTTKLNRNKLAIVQSIAVWREQLAQQQDKIRRKILADEVIIQLALNPPDDTNALDQLIDRKLTFKIEDRQQLFDIIQNAQQFPENLCPDSRFSALDNPQKLLLKNLQKMVNKKAEELGISSAILYSRKDLEDLILRSNDGSESSSLELYNKSWRYHCIGQHLIDTVKNAK